MEINAHERINEDDRNLCKLAISELGVIYSDLGLSKEELDLLDMPKRSFIVHVVYSFPNSSPYNIWILRIKMLSYQ